MARAPSLARSTTHTVPAALTGEQRASARAASPAPSLLATEPRSPSFRNLRAVVLCRLGDYAPAIAIYDGLVARYPHQAKLWLSLGHALKTEGERERAIAAYRRAIALEPGFGEAWWSLANLKTFRFVAADEAAMLDQLHRGDLAPEQRAQFEFALGKAREDAGDAAAAFAHYANGNRLRSEQVPYRSEDSRQRVRRSVALFTPEFLRAREGQGCAAADRQAAGQIQTEVNEAKPAAPSADKLTLSKEAAAASRRARRRPTRGRRGGSSRRRRR